MKSKFILAFVFLSISSYISAQSVQDFDRLRQEYEAALRAMEQAKPIQGDIDTERPSVEVLTPRAEQAGRASQAAAGVLQYFGYDFFTASRSVPIWENLPVQADYRLGPGDEVIISLWGETQMRSSHTINRNGNVYIDKVGQISVTGKTLEEAKAYLTSRFEQVYATLRNPNPTTFLDISLGALKSINVKFVGEVNPPGILPVHPFSTVVTGLIQAGGVRKSGSLREIQVIRAGKVFSIVDLYAFLLQGKTDGDIRLRDQDVVFVPVRKSTIRVEGIVQRPGVYEALPGESLANVLAFSGGLMSDAQARLAVERTIALAEREHDDNAIAVFYVDYGDVENVTVQNGDKIYIHEIHPVQLQVLMRGQVKNPGIYAFQDSMRLLDLLNLAGGFNDESYWKSVYPVGADVIRRDEIKEYATIIPINLERLRQGDESQNILLHNLDQVIVRQNPHFDPPKNITILGEVGVPGVYSLTSDNETLSDIIARANGFTNRAFEEGIRMYRQGQRVVLRDYSLTVAAGDSIFVPEYPGVVLVTGEVYNSGFIHYKSDRSLKEYLESAGGLTRDASKRDVSVILANGDVKLRRYFFDPRVKEGATIIVHRKQETTPFDLTKFLTEVASITASLATIIFILSRP
ncbi:SLBB domain-containing protein [Candidatus Neomarinimicrobiota bacterium]